MDTTTQRESVPKQSRAGHGETVAPGCDIPAQSHPTAAQVERCQERLTSLASSFAYAAPEVGHRFQAEAAECLNTIARYFGLRDSQSAPNADEVRPRPAVARFTLLMEEVLRANDHKTGWLDMQPDALMELLDQKVAKLREAIYQRVTGELDAEAFERKGANVANFAMMIVDRVEWGIGNKREVAS